jgi:exopolyphosphatase/guanosine-5'-triphosphate,3'-diphosphate pyrophosphatase
MTARASVRRLATVDLGTNTVRLLVVETDGTAWRRIGQDQRVTRLGEGQARAGRLLAGPMQRTVDAVAAFVAAARRLGASQVRIVATSAVREAANRAEFERRVEAATGAAVEVVSGEDEARLTLEGVAASLPALRGDFVLFDVGGGSTEFVLARGGVASAAVSLRLGVVALAERFAGPGPVDEARLAAMRRHVDGCLAEGVPAAIAEGGAPSLVGTAGTVTTLAALDLGLAAYDPDRVHGHVLARAAVERLLHRLAPLTAAGREALPGVERGRGDLLIAGIAIVLSALDRLGFGALTVSDRGLREGILAAWLAGG